MKRILLYTLLFSYTIIMVKPVMPYVSDIIAHAFWYSQHMATVHYENGKYHVHAEIFKAEKNNSNENQGAPKKEITGDEHLIVSQQFDHLPYKFMNTLYASLSPLLLYGHPLHNDIPPKI